MQRFDVVVVGGGSAGCVLAARLSERPGRRVLLLEAGPVHAPDEARDVTSLAAADPRHPLNWAYPTELARGVPGVIPRGRLLGGSGAINGAYFVRPTPADLDGWGIPGWGYADLLPFHVRSEHDLDLGAAPGHGDRGPIPVRRPAGALLSPTTEPFLRAARRLGHPDEPDKNSGGPPGAGPIPSNAVNGVRISAALGYVAPARARPNLVVRGGTTVQAVLLDGDRAVGVRVRDRAGPGDIEAGEVVLAAGAIGSPHLLALSGIGPADQLRAAGITVRHDLPVGHGFSDHPAVFLPFRPHATAPPHPHAVTAQVALHLDSGADPAGDVELLLFGRPFDPAGDLHVMCALQAPASRGAITTISADPAVPPRIEHRYLRTEADRRRLRHAVRTAADLLRAGLGTRTDPGGDVLGTDVALDGWIKAHLTTSSHLCATAAIGPVVGPDLRVHGVAGLRVADTSVFPVVPRRGPAAAAIALGERAAALGWDA